MSPSRGSQRPDVLDPNGPPDSPEREKHQHRPPAPWDRPILFSTWGLGKRKWSPEELVAEAKVRGFGMILAEHGQQGADLEARLRVACRNALIVPGVWDPAVDYGTPMPVSQGWDVYVGQIEGPGQRDRLVDSPPPLVAHAVVSNFGGLDSPDLAAPLIANGYHCIAESWLKTNPAGTPAAQVDYARRVLGFPTASPMAGLGENGATLTDYPGLDTFPGWSVFPAEQLLA